MLLLYPSKQERRKIKARAYQKKYIIKNNMYEYYKTYRKAYQKAYQSTPEQKAKNNARYKNPHRREYVLEYMKTRGQSKNHNTHQRVYKQTPSGKITDAKSICKRKRELGHDILNDWFYGCRMHHINKTQIICIPEAMHITHHHSRDNLEQMKIINDLAVHYMFTL